MTSSYGPVISSGTVISYLPLTTAWSASAQCSSLFLDTAGYLYLNAPEYHNGVSGSPECVPPEVSSWWYQSLNTASPTQILLGGYDFSCPEAYTTAFSYFDASTSTIGCCPSQYTYGGTWWQHGNPYQCSSSIAPGTITYVQSYTGSVYTTTSSYVSTSTMITGVQVNGFKVETAQQTTTSSTTQPTSTQSNSVSSSSSTNTTSAAIINSPSITNNHSGLDDKAKIGIGIGVSLGAITLVGILAIWLVLRRKQNRQAIIPPRENIVETTAYAKPELDSAPAPANRVNPTTVLHHELESSPKNQPLLAEME